MSAPARGPGPESSPRGGGLLRRLLSLLFVAAALAFVGVAIARNWAGLRTARWDLDPAGLVASTVLLVAVLAFGVGVWGRVLRHFQGGGAPFPTLFRIWFLSGIARYIPGKVWQFVAAAGLARRAGLTPVVVLSSLVVYMGFGLLSAAVLAALTVPLGPMGGVAVPPGWVVAGTVAAALLLVHPAVINFGLRLVPRALHESVLAWRGSWLEGVRLLVLATVYWLLYAGAFWLFVDALVDIPPASVLLLGGVNALSFVVGYLVFVVPAGLGPREGVITVALAGVVGGTGMAGVVALASRLWIVAAELIGAGISLLLERRGAG
ncbi:MAG TPA: lysylphosphatidylglycerol synthase domain-containing protein [Longimicrobiales bacterium]|nr:lysylphosphatidylglycerol synthase domain-containing protein [Longimicrobiales bacterium]